MTLFTVLYVRRSDGKIETIGKGKQKEKNEPTPEQLDPTPDTKGVSDYYRFIPQNELKHLDWRRKLAGMLMRELGGKEHSLDKAYILDDLPQSYRLYEHVKSKATDPDGKPAKNTKTHAGGGHDRQDAYLYGHPLGRKKRFRSPADFFPHLLWLATDEVGDPNNCACKVCSPEELQPDTKPSVLVDLKKEGTPIKKEESESRTIISRNPIVEIPARSVSNSNVKPSGSITPSVTAAASPAQRIPTPQTLTPTPLPPPRSTDQQIDASFGRYTFRPGELVWFSREVAWGLGVIIRRWILVGVPHPDNRAYLVQPLSSPFDVQPQKVITSETLLKPWLAWSPPQYCHPGLNRLEGLTYNNADWQAIGSGAYGPSNESSLTIDGSILAARRIDSSYTLFGFVKSIPAIKQDIGNSGSAASEIHWNGVYFGSEKIWVGEPVRLRMSSGEDVLVISDIIERSQPAFNTPAQSTTKVTLVGDIYTCSTVPPNSQQPQTDERAIPLRMREDLRARNRASALVNGPTYFWKLMQTRANLDLGDAKGRWYEATIMLPIVNGAQVYANALRTGTIESVERHLNGRTDHSRAIGTRAESREAAFGQAVPTGTRVIEGTDVPQLHELPPEHPPQPMQMQYSTGDSAQADSVMAGVGPEQGGAALVDEFMNLDGMEQDPMPGFGQDYGSQDSFFR